jgi:predicted nucleic acid-binding protein
MATASGSDQGMLPFLDSNILVRHLTQDHADHSPRATAYLDRVERGELKVRTADTVVFEVVFTLQRGYRQPKARIREMLLPLIQLPGIVLPGKRRWRRVFDLYVDRNISFADAYHAVLMEGLHLTEVISFDHDFDRVPWVTRVEP